uniref:Neprosin PEP catalytic domain-containing protein n=1 Tax=Oryza rufipogon TaxID=4529 RepID=A0A0E0Q1S7_ORYRU
MECPGFQLESGASIQPGDFIPGVSRPNGARQYMALKVFKDSASGDWLVYYGFNSDPELIGRLSKSIFSGLAYKAIALWFSGMAINNATFQPTPALPPVGSGYMAGHGSNMAASMSNIQLIDEQGQALSTAKHFIGFSSNPKLYSYTAIVDDQFFYGGPGRTTSSDATSSTTAIYSLLALFILLLL